MSQKMKQYIFMKDVKAENKSTSNQNFKKGCSYYLNSAQAGKYKSSIKPFVNKGAPKAKKSEG